MVKILDNAEREKVARFAKEYPPGCGGYYAVPGVVSEEVATHVREVVHKLKEGSLDLSLC